MSEYDRELSIGEQQLLRRGSEPPDGWRNRTPINLAEGDVARFTGGAQVTRRRPRGHGGPTEPPPPPPPPPDPIDPPDQLGYAGLYNSGEGVAGGMGGTLMTPTNWTELRAAIQSGTSPRIVKPTASAIIDGGGQTAAATVGGMTLDFINHTRSLRHYNLILKSSDIIVRNMKGRPADHASLPDAAAAIMLNPGTAATMSGILLEFNHLAWAMDVNGNHFNAVTDVTWQYNIIGPALYETPYKAGTNGYGFSTHGDAIRHRRITVARNLLLHNYHRNLRGFAVDFLEHVNNVVYNWGNHPAESNPIGANYVGNMFKKGPGTDAANLTGSSALYGVDSSYHLDAIWWDDNKLWSSSNGVLTPTTDFAAGVERGSPYGGGLHNITAAAASLALLAEVAAAAGTPSPDSLETALKADVTSGTWNGAGADDWYRTTPGAPVQPSWP